MIFLLKKNEEKDGKVNWNLNLKTLFKHIIIQIDKNGRFRGGGQATCVLVRCTMCMHPKGKSLPFLMCSFSGHTS